jgi:hypothetical protein
MRPDRTAALGWWDSRSRGVRVDGEDDIHPGLDQVLGRGGKRLRVPLREADAEDELLALSIAQR